MTHEILPNGLEVFILVDRKSPIFSFCIFYRVGSMDERPGITGACHIVEHMRFKGNSNLKGPDIDRYVNRHGGSMNGITSEDSTSFFMAMPSSELEYPIKVEVELMTEAAFDYDEFETERNVVKEERRLRTEDSPIGALFEALKATAFWAHPYRWPVIGWMSDISQITRDEAYEFYRSFYRPENAFIIIRGDVDPDITLNLIRRHFGKIAPSSPVKRAKMVEPSQDGIRRTIIRKPAELPIIIMGFHSPNLDYEDVYPLIVAEKILSSGESSRIYREIVYEKRIATLAGGFYNYFSRDPGLFMFFAQASGDTHPEMLEKALWDEVDKICTKKAADEEIEKAKNLVETDFIYRKEENLSESFLRGLFHLSGNIDKYDDFPERVREVTSDKVREVCEKIFTKNNATIAELYPINKKRGNGNLSANPSYYFYNFPEHENRISAIPKSLDGLPYWNDAHKFELSNHIRVICYERHELPIFQIAILVNAGSVYDPDGKAGLANITGNLLRAGTASRTSYEISSEIENVGGEFSISSHREYIILGMRILSRHARIALDILSECLIYPSLLDEEVQRYKELASGDIKSIEDDVWSLTWREFNRMIYQGSVYAQPVLGELETVDKINPDDVKQFHAEHFTSDSTLIVVVGDFNPGKLRDDLELYFNKMPFGKKHAPPDLIFKPLKESVISRYPKELDQASVALGGPLFPRKSEDYFPYLALDYILGYGSFTSRLGTKIRQEKGLTYSIDSGMTTMSHTGTWNIMFQTKKENVDEAIKLVRDEMRKLRDSKVTDEELNDFKTNFRGRSSFDIESNRGLAQKLITVAYYGLGDDYLANFFKNAENVTKEQIMNVANKYLDPDKFKLLIVGDV